MGKYNDKLRQAKVNAATKRLKNYTVKGKWAEDVTYQVDDVVIFGNGLYKAVKESLNNIDDFVPLDTIIPKDGLPGKDAEDIDIDILDGAIQWKRGDQWNTLIEVDKLIGPAGKDGADGRDGINGKDGISGKDGKNGTQGKAGKNAKEIELRKTNSHIQWRRQGEPWNNLVALSDLKGSKGDKGEKGDRGLSAYEIWLENGNRGSERDFLESLRGRQAIIARGGGAAVWGGITGTLSDQTDLQAALDAAGNSFMRLQDTEYTSTYGYVGYEHTTDGSWYIYRRTLATNARLYASGASSYATNWTNRGSLTYA